MSSPGKQQAEEAGLFARLGSLHPLWYLIIYFCLIPIFAGLYSGITPDGFYAPYTPKETSWPSRQLDVAVVFYKDMLLRVRTNLCEPPGLFVRSGTTWKLHQILDPEPYWALPTQTLYSRYYANCKSFGLTLPTTDGQTIRVNFEIKMKESRRTRLSHNKTEAPVSDLRFDTECKYTEDTYPRRGVLDCALIDESDPDLSKPRFRSAIQARKLIGAIISGKSVVMGDEVSTLTDFQSAFLGTSTSIGKDHWRMLYLSVVILTTLGLGDIVPVANNSRLLVGLEATSGIFVAGLFLNALAWQASRKIHQEGGSKALDEGSKPGKIAGPKPQPDDGQAQPGPKPT